ncbi:hypothetical protein B0H16DRAFT_1689939 [Mycena metata]|uniref:Uncharacterized protein n=1 Tax=Mycena metata TaxID=1033252 RepID=A0AAD7J4V4_9AGAR|nr:hypothetical protein B0H16DRAFT_1689939 [Mycena metata]
MSGVGERAHGRPTPMMVEFFKALIPNSKSTAARCKMQEEVILWAAPTPSPSSRFFVGCNCPSAYVGPAPYGLISVLPFSPAHLHVNTSAPRPPQILISRLDTTPTATNEFEHLGLRASLGSGSSGDESRLLFELELRATDILREGRLPMHPLFRFRVNLPAAPDVGVLVLGERTTRRRPGTSSNHGLFFGLWRTRDSNSAQDARASASAFASISGACAVASLEPRPSTLWLRGFNSNPNSNFGLASRLWVYISARSAGR